MDTLEALMTTRAIRRFTDEAVTDDEILTCLRAAQQAPSGGNVQPQQYLVVTDPDRRAELARWYRAAFDRYEKALNTNDLAVLNDIFKDAPQTIRYGIGENLYGYDQIRAFRGARPPVGLLRTISQTVITTYGRDHAVASTLFKRETVPGKIGRQQQTWVRFPDGWHVVAAHVSLIDDK